MFRSLADSCSLDFCFKFWIFCSKSLSVKAGRLRLFAAYNDAVSGENIRLEFFKPCCSYAWAPGHGAVLRRDLVDFAGGQVEYLVMIGCLVAGHFFDDVPGNVCTGFEGHRSDLAMAMAPDFVQGLGYVDLIALWVFGVLALIGKIDPEKDCMIVRPAGLFTVLAAMEIADLPRVVRFPKAHHEGLEVFNVKRTVGRQMRIVVCERDEDRQVVHLPFVHEPDGPLPGSFQATADALSTSHGNGQITVAGTPEGQLPLARLCGQG